MQKITDSQYQTICSGMATNLAIVNFDKSDIYRIVADISKSILSHPSGLRNYLVERGYPARYAHMYITKDIFKYMPRI